MRLVQERGFEIVCPEELSWPDQIALFARAKILIGESGSALHNAIFCDSNTVVLCIRPANQVQASIAGVRRQQLLFFYPEEEHETEAGVEFAVDVPRFARAIEQCKRLATEVGWHRELFRQPADHQARNTVHVHDNSLSEGRRVRCVTVAEAAEAAPPRPLLYKSGPNCDGVEARHLALKGHVQDLAIYFVSDATVYGDIFVETGGQLLTEAGLMLPYVSGQISSGAIDLHEQRRMRTEALSVDGPAAFFGSVAPTVFGHWLVDIWPRAWLLASFLGAETKNYKVLLPANSPNWGLDVLEDVFGYSRSNMVLYEELHQRVETPMCVVPTYLHQNFVFHPEFLRYVTYLKDKSPNSVTDGAKRIFLSRRGYREKSLSYRRSLVNEDEIEALFERNGFRIIAPEMFKLHDQIALFRNATIIAGEAGSALHNSMFSAPQAVVLSLNFNEVQSALCALGNQELMYILPTEQRASAGGTELTFDCRELSAAIDIALEYEPTAPEGHGPLGQS
jgi:capsular polysaccharide biosynthesis protein